jgi:hypothetical protein
MRSALSRLAVAALTTASMVALADPAQAALSDRALWNMDSLPTMVDSAGGDNNGTTKNLSLSGGGYLFNSRSDIATAPDSATLDPGSATIKVTARVKFSSVPAVNGTFDIVRKGLSSTAGGEYKIEITRSSSGQAVASCTFKGSKNVAVHSVGTVNLAGSAFQTITCTKTATAVQVTAGGQTRTTTKAVGSISNSSAVFVGGKGDGTDAFPGVIDFVKIQIG